MKFIKYAVGLVIALSVIPMVVVAVTKLDEPRLQTVEFEVVDIDDTVITFTDNTYNNIHSLAIVDDLNAVTNLITTTVNGLELVNDSLVYLTPGYNFSDANDDFAWYDLTDTNTTNSDGYTPTIGDKWTMTFDVSTKMPPLIKLLVGFAPLLFVGGILLFMLNKRKFE